MLILRYMGNIHHQWPVCGVRGTMILESVVSILRLAVVWYVVQCTKFCILVAWSCWLDGCGFQTDYNLENRKACPLFANQTLFHTCHVCTTICTKDTTWDNGGCQSRNLNSRMCVRSPWKRTFLAEKCRCIRWYVHVLWCMDDLFYSPQYCQHITHGALLIYFICLSYKYHILHLLVYLFLSRLFNVILLWAGAMQSSFTAFGWKTCLCVMRGWVTWHMRIILPGRQHNLPEHLYSLLCCCGKA